MTDFGWRDIHVLECSQVRTPADFWALYLERVEVRSPDTFGRNLDAFWDALSSESHELEDVSALLGPGPHILESVEGGRRNGGSVDVTLMSGATIRLDPLTLSDPDSDFVLTVEPAP